MLYILFCERTNKKVLPFLVGFNKLKHNGILLFIKHSSHTQFFIVMSVFILE
jgi:hypothetical protein